MTPQAFIQTYYAHAYKCWQDTGIHPIATLSQAALESGWGEHAPGNMFFGVKDTDGVNGNEQLITTVEYSRSASANFPRIVSITPTVINGQKFFKYIIEDYFRKYNTAAESFSDHARFFFANSRYAQAIAIKSDPFKFLDAVAAAGYATAPNYAKELKDTAGWISRYITANCKPLVPIS